MWLSQSGIWSSLSKAHSHISFLRTLSWTDKQCLTEILYRNWFIFLRKMRYKLVGDMSSSNAHRDRDFFGVNATDSRTSFIVISFIVTNGILPLFCFDMLWTVPVSLKCMTVSCMFLMDGPFLKVKPHSLHNARLARVKDPVDQ